MVMICFTQYSVLYYEEHISHNSSHNSSFFCFSENPKIQKKLEIQKMKKMKKQTVRTSYPEKKKRSAQEQEQRCGGRRLILRKGSW